MPGLWLTLDDLDRMGLDTWIRSDKTVGLGKDRVRMPLDTRSHSNMTKTWWMSLDEENYSFREHTLRLVMFQNGIFPTKPGQHVSHRCDLWTCANVEDGHIVFEDSQINQYVRKCNDKKTKEV